jgi:hypothetical protein
LGVDEMGGGVGGVNEKEQTKNQRPHAAGSETHELSMPTVYHKKQ